MDPPGFEGSTMFIFYGLAPLALSVIIRISALSGSTGIGIEIKIIGFICHNQSINYDICLSKKITICKLLISMCISLNPMKLINSKTT